VFLVIIIIKGCFATVDGNKRLIHLLSLLVYAKMYLLFYRTLLDINTKNRQNLNLPQPNLFNQLNLSQLSVLRKCPNRARSLRWVSTMLLVKFTKLPKHFGLITKLNKCNGFCLPFYLHFCLLFLLFHFFEK